MDGENETKVAISHCALCEDPNFIYRDCVLDAATAMRDKCVEKVKELQDEWADRRRRFGSNNDRAHVKWGTMVTAAIEISIALERMPIDLDAAIKPDRECVRKTMLQSARDVCEYCGGRATAFFSAAQGPNEARNFYHQHRTDKAAQALCKATAIYHRISSLTLDQVKPGEM